MLYKSFINSNDHNSSEDRLYDGASGILSSWVFKNLNDYQNPIFAPRYTNRLIGYYRIPSDPNDVKSLGAIYKFDINIGAPINPNDPPEIESLIPNSNENHRVLVNESEGLANNRLFTTSAMKAL